MTVPNFSLGDTVKDTSTGRVGRIVKILGNHIVPGLKQGVVEFENPSSHELLYFTRLQAVQGPQEPSLEEYIASLEEEDAEKPESEDKLRDTDEVINELVVVAEKLDEDRLDDNGAPPAPVKRPRGRPRKVVVEEAPQS